MAGQLPALAVCAKGWVPFALEEASRRRDGREILQQLYVALRYQTPEFEGLSDLFGSYLLAPLGVAAPKIERIVSLLNAHWFGDTNELELSYQLFFPTEPVSSIYGLGILKTLELSLAGNPNPLPITAWWLPDFPSVKLLTLSDETAVELLILTPRPIGIGHGTFVLRREATIWIAEADHGQPMLHEMPHDG